MDDSIHIYTARWIPEDYVSELNCLLEGVSVDNVEKTLIKYVVENIEPCGWNAIWQPVDEKIVALYTEDDSTTDSFIVEVKNVSMITLEASIIIIDAVQNGVKITAPKKLCVCKDMKVPLVEIFPLADQENHHLDITGTVEVIELVRFFYDHIWLPWDVEEDFCCYEEDLISNRIKLYQDIVSNLIPDDVSKELRLIVMEAKATRIKIDEIKLTAEKAFDGEVQETDLVHLIKLHKSLDELKSRHKYLKDPVLRGIAEHGKILESRSLIESFSSEENTSDILLVCSSCSAEEYVSSINKLPQILKKLPMISEDAKIKNFPFLQLALDSSKIGDTIVLLPGRYKLSRLGDIGSGGSICGLEGLVEIIGSSSSGDVMLDLHLQSTFTLHSIELLPLKNQSAIVVHNGELVMENCSIIDCNLGVTLLRDSTCKMVNCNVPSPKKHSLVCRSGSQQIFSDTTTDILTGSVI